MAQHRRTYTQRGSSRRSRQVREQTIGTHVSHSTTRAQRGRTYAEGVARKSNARRIIVIVAVLAVIAAIAVGAGVMAFRGFLGSEMSLKDSNANEALKAVKADEPSYTLVSVELGAVAEPLENDGPDVFLVAYLDPKNKTVTLVNVPCTLQITVDNKSSSLNTLASKSDAELINALTTNLKIDISHYVKIDETGVVKMVDTLGGIPVDVDQVIDDPQAGSIYLDEGNQTLDGASSLVYLRATNIKMGEEGRMNHQLDFATRVIEKVFEKTGNFATRLDSLSSCFQTDMTLGDLEAINSWLGGVSASSITCTTLPGYTTESTEVTGANAGRFIGSSSEIQQLFSAIEKGESIDDIAGTNVSTVNPSSFTVEIQNGTSIAGAAAVTAESLKSRGFNVTEVGNAEQPVYEETLVVYKGEEGASRAKTVINALGVGRAVSAGAYYSFDADVLVIIGADYKPVS